MDAETLEALKGSIRKWEAIVDGTGTDKGSDNCPLCKLFLPRDCAGCPVMEKTGRRSCLETPYVDYLWAAGGRSGGALTEAFRELDFLRSLMPESPASTTKTASQNLRIGQRVRVLGNYKESPGDFSLVGRVGVVQDEGPDNQYPYISFDGLKSGHAGSNYDPSRKDTWAIPLWYLELVEDEVSGEKKFWAVYKDKSLNESGWVSSLRYPTKEEADKKAMKQVSQHGGTYYVLECVGVATAADVKLKSVA